MRLIALALLLAGCSAAPTLAPVVHRDAIPARPGDPGSPHLVGAGYYADGSGSWISIGEGADSAAIVGWPTPDTLRFHLGLHHGYVSAVNGPDAEMFALFDYDALNVEMRYVEAASGVEWYVNRRLERVR
jgi:hypothetical protein